jgi:hypothetical protein
MNKEAFPATPGLNARLAAAPYLALVVLAVSALFLAAAMSIVDVAPMASENPEAFEAQPQDDTLQAFIAQRYGTAYVRFAAFGDEERTPSALLALALARLNSPGSRQRLALRAQ